MKLASPSTAAVSLLLISGSSISDAFVPLSSPAKSQFVTSSKSESLMPPPMARSTSSTTSLSMMAGGNLFDRFIRVVNANLNKLVSSVENPEKVIVQAVEDMQNDLVKIRQAYAEATTGQRRLLRQKQQADAEGDDWYNRANFALQRGNEGLAREALARRQQYVEKSKDLQIQIDTQRVATDKLYEAMTALEAKISEAASKKQQLVARARTAKSTQQVNDMLSGLTGKTSMDAFNRMEQKVEALEAAAEASGEMGLTALNSSTEAEFRLLEQSSEVEDELRKMKNSMKLLSSSRSENTSGTSIPVGSSKPTIREVRERVSIPAGKGETVSLR